MESIIPEGQARAASAFPSLMPTLTRVQAAAERLTARASKPDVVVPAVAFGVFLLSVHPAFAQATGGTGSLVTFLNNVVNLITGTVGQALAIIACALAGVGAMYGALSYRAFGGVVLGCAIVFSAAWIVGQITGGGAGGFGVA